jgi:hypothetical protein
MIVTNNQTNHWVERGKFARLLSGVFLFRAFLSFITSIIQSSTIRKDLWISNCDCSRFYRNTDVIKARFDDFIRLIQSSQVNGSGIISDASYHVQFNFLRPISKNGLLVLQEWPVRTSEESTESIFEVVFACGNRWRGLNLQLHNLTHKA